MENISSGLNHFILHHCAPVLSATLFIKHVTSLTLPQALMTTTFLEGTSYFVDKKIHFSEKLNQNPLMRTFVSVAISIAAFSILHFSSPLFFPIGGTFARRTTTQLLGSSTLKFLPGLFCIQFLFKECFFKKIPLQNAHLHEPNSAHIVPHQPAPQGNIDPAAPPLSPTTDPNEQNTEGIEEEEVYYECMQY